VCILCASYAYPHRKYVELRNVFRMSRAKLSGIISKTQSLLLVTWKEKIRFDRRMVTKRARMYAEALTLYQHRHRRGRLVKR